MFSIQVKINWHALYNSSSIADFRSIIWVFIQTTWLLLIQFIYVYSRWISYSWIKYWVLNDLNCQKKFKLMLCVFDWISSLLQQTSGFKCFQRFRVIGYELFESLWTLVGIWTEILFFEPISFCYLFPFLRPSFLFKTNPKVIFSLVEHNQRSQCPTKKMWVYLILRFGRNCTSITNFQSVMCC